MMMNRYLRFLCVLSLLLISACGLIVEPGREVVVEIGEEDVIRVRDIQGHIRDLPFEERALANDTNKDARMNFRRDVALNMVIDKLMILEARARGLEASEQEIEQALAQKEEQEAASGGEHAANAPRGNEPEFGQGGSGREQHNHAQWEIDDARNNLLIEKYKAEAFGKEEMRKHFDKTKDKYKLEAPLYAFEIIAVAPENAAIVDSIYRAAAAKNLSLLGTYDAMGKPSAMLAVGLIPPTPLDKFLPAIQNAVKNLKYYETTKPFQYSERGVEHYAIMRTMRILRGQSFKMAFEEVKEDLYEKVIKDLHAKYNAVYHDDKLNYSVGE
jgi:hypothetical protein